LIKRFPPIYYRTGLPFIKKIKGIVLITLLLLLMGFFHKGAPPADARMIIHFRALVHGEPLQMNKKYRNRFGEIFGISRFRFYAGKMAPVYMDTAFKSNITSSYHLIDFTDSASTYIELPVNAGDFNGIQFLLGVDSTDQTRGAQSGALDPVRGMFWTWNSGYLSFKMEGFSPASTQPAHMMAYHIGGYRYPYSTVWKVRINTPNDEVFRITKENKITVVVAIDLDYFFDGQTPLHIKDIATCTTPGELARKISENFIGTFTGLTLTPDP
jgi:hypothetical protein